MAAAAEKKLAVGAAVGSRKHSLDISHSEFKKEILQREPSLQSLQVDTAFTQSWVSHIINKIIIIMRVCLGHASIMVLTFGNTSVVGEIKSFYFDITNRQ